MVDMDGAVMVDRAYGLARELCVTEGKATDFINRLVGWVERRGLDGDLCDVPDDEIAEIVGWGGDAVEFREALEEAGVIELDGVLAGDVWTTPRIDPRISVRRAWDKMRHRVRPIIFARDGYCCIECGCRERLEIDHIYPIARGGTNELTNLQTLCGPCNVNKGAS